MNIRTSSAAVLSFVLISSNAFARGSYREIWQNSESTIQSFKTVSKCTERVWPGLSWKGYSFLSVNNSKDLQVAYDVDTDQTYRISLKDLENSKGAYQAYDFFKSNGKDWVSVNESFVKWGAGKQALFALGAHESFHYIGQRGWAYKEGRGGRGTDIPVRWEPRYYRAKLYANLREAFLNPSMQKEALGKAAFWFNKWKNEFPNEVLAATDGYEGTAKYADHISKGLAIHGCKATEEQLAIVVRESVATSPIFTDFVKSNGGLAADLEGYPIGAVASFLLRWRFPVDGWQSRVASKADTPLEILLENVVPLSDELLSNETAKFIQSSRAEQKIVNDYIGDTINKLKGDYVVVLIPQDYKPGATGYSGFYNDTQTDFRYSILSEALMLKGKAGYFRTAENAVQFSGTSSPCKEWGWQFVVAANELQVSGDAGFVQSLKIVGQAKGALKTSFRDSVKYFCVGE